MQQPNTNSEAVKRCLTIPDAPLSSQMKHFQPHPPYAVNKPKTRPYSVPARNILASNQSAHWRSPHYQEPRLIPKDYTSTLYHRSSESNLSRKTPYASRKTEFNGYTKSVFGYPSAEGYSMPLPSYNPLNDPHLVEYFWRRFGYIQRAHSAKQVRINGGSSKSTKTVLYKIFVTTTDKQDAGTDAKVYITLKGMKGKINRMRLTKKAGSVKSNKKVSYRFSKGTTNMFKIRGPEIGNLKSIIIEHDGIKKEDGWHLQEIEVVNTKRDKRQLFICNQWLSLHHGDGLSKRELFPHLSSKTDYEIVTVTGDKQGAGTDANVYITIYGRSGITSKIPLRTEKSKSLFERGKSDMFKVHANCVGPMKKILIEHDNTGMAPGWFLDRVVVTDLKHSKWKYFFPCGQWLSKDEGDRAISRYLLGSRDPFAVRKESKYKISVYTGDKRGAGTDANVYIILFGENGDSGQKGLDNSKNNFERSSLDEFTITCPCVGRLQKIRIGHDNSGFAAGWFLDKVIVDDLDNSITYQFPCGRWLADNEDDGQIFRDLVVGVGPMDGDPGIPYEIRVMTGDKANAGTSAKVFVIMYGRKEDSGIVWLKGGEFKRGMTQIFNVSIIAQISPLTKLDIGHDNSGAGPGWFLEMVSVYCPSTGLEQVFPCHKWLAKDEGDKQIQRTLYEDKDKRKEKDKKVTWLVWVSTSDIKFAGTDSKVYICLYGSKDKGKTEEVLLDNKGDPFEQAQIDQFKVSLDDVGNPYKLRVYHDNSGRLAAWHLDKIEMENDKKERYTFLCNRWLAENEDDGSCVRELPAAGPGIKKPLPVEKYLVQVYTGKKFKAGTNANVYINIFGERGDTGIRYLTRSKTNKDKFESGKMDEFELEAVSLLKLKKIRIGHDGRGAGAGWFLGKVVVKLIGHPEYDTEFACNRWLAEDEDDGLIEREITASGSQMLTTTSYHIHLKTGDIRGAGTDANVYLIIFGSKGDTGTLQLRQSSTNINKFERGKVDIFKIEATDIGQIKRIRIGHDGSKPGSGWFLDEVKILVPSRGEQYMFACHRWLDTKEEDGQLEVELELSVKENMEKTIPYEITVWTGDVRGGGTDANVFIQMYGEDGKSEECFIRNKTDNFEQGQEDKFKIEAADVGRIQKIRIGHDGAGMLAGWFLEKLLIQRKPRKGTKKRKRRPSSARSRSRSPLQSRMDISDSDSDISSVSSPRRKRPHSSGSIKSKSLKTVKEEEEEESEYDGTETEDYWFFVKRWFAKNEDDKEIVRELIPTDEHGRPLKGALEEVEYIVKVYTGKKSGAGTDANVFIQIYGQNGDTGERQLKESSKNINKFESGKEDIFKIKAIDIGKFSKLKIRHDNSGPGAAWFLDRVEVEDPKRKQSSYFPCQRWLATGEDDGQISRELVPVDPSLKEKMNNKDAESIRKEIALETKAATTTYKIEVITGTVFGAGTDANVYIILFGELDDTGKKFLKSSLTNKNKFEGGNKDLFILEAVSIGELKKIKIGHDNKGGGAAWFLEQVNIDCPSLGRNWKFPCNRWLDKSKGDGALEVELFPQDLDTEEYIPSVPYEIITHTSDISSAGTSANVYIQLYGKEVATQQKNLCISKLDRKDKFKRGAVDRFIVELEDVGKTVEKIRIGHDNSGIGAGWHLDKVEVRRLHDSGKGSVTYTFPCNRWLARNEDDAAIERELVAEQAIQETVTKSGKLETKQVKIKDHLEMKKYTVNVHTGDVSGAGTDANVFITIFGDKGDTGERKLHKSETYSDKFERNHIDRFIMEAADLGNLFKIRIRHDNSMMSPAWYLDYVEVIDTTNNQSYMFHCERWLAKNKDDGKIERTLYVKGYDGEMSSTGTLRSTARGSVLSLDSLKSSDPFSKSPRLTRKAMSMTMENIPEGPTIPYTLHISTGDGEDNGTNSNVWVCIIGPKKETGKMFLELYQKDRFAPGSIETISIEALDVNEIKKIEIGHDGITPGSGWYLKQVEVNMPTKGKHYTFPCKKWLARDKEDGKTSRFLHVDDGISSVTSFKPMIAYEMTVYTGDVQDAGTDTKITVTLFGAKGTASPVVLEKAGDRFERDRADLIRLELEDVAPVKKMRVETDGKGSRPDWFLEKIELRNMDSGALSVFECGEWFSKSKKDGKDGKLVRDLPCKEKGKLVIGKASYKISVKTSDVKGAGTDANVYIILFGANGDSGELHLKKSETYKDPFENNQIDVFTFHDMLSLGELAKCRVWHDNKGLGAAWHLNYIEVEDLGTKKTFLFPCNRWLSKSDDDKQILRELTCGSNIQSSSTNLHDENIYEIEVKTTDKKEGGTIHNGWLILEGKNGVGKVFKMENSPANKILRKGNTDLFTMTSPKSLGKLKTCTIGAYQRKDRPITEAEGREAMWHCHEITVTDVSKGDKYVFAVRSWIPICETIDKKKGKTVDVKEVEESQVAKVRNLGVVKYNVLVVTGDKSGAGTNANVSITIFGENGDTGKRILKQSFRDLFEKGQKDEFEIEAVDLGELHKIRIEHDNSGFRPGWFLDRVEITNKSTGVVTLFPCDRWLDKEKDDNAISRDLYPRD